ncbi:hypothetical protein GQ457_09G014090 [Hibiscus cannabinus]
MFAKLKRLKSKLYALNKMHYDDISAKVIAKSQRDVEAEQVLQMKLLELEKLIGTFDPNFHEYFNGEITSEETKSSLFKQDNDKTECDTSFGANCRPLVLLSGSDASLPASGWSSLPAQWVKLNCDGARRTNDNNASCGGIFQDSAGECLYGFSKFIGCCSIVETELWAIWVGLGLAWSKGFRPVMVETDCLDAIRLLRCLTLRGSSITLVRDIQRLCNQNWHVSFHRVSRSNNRVAYSLAKLATSSSFDVLHFAAPSFGIVYLL